MLGQIAVKILIGCGFMAAVVTLGGVFIFVCANLQWKWDERRAKRQLAEIAAKEDEAKAIEFRAEARLLGQFAKQLEEIRNLPVANPWEVA